MGFWIIVSQLPLIYDIELMPRELRRFFETFAMSISIGLNSVTKPWTRAWMAPDDVDSSLDGA